MSLEEYILVFTVILYMNLQSYKKTSDKVLRTYVKKKIQQAHKIASWPRPHAIVSYIDDSIFSGWKRIRPYLVYLWYKIFWWKKDNEVIRFAWAAELIHSMALIHDDIIDNGDLRHNKPCFHKYASDLSNAAHHEHLGISQAILAWDLIYSWAYEVMYDEYSIPAKQLRNAQKHMQTMIEEVVTWQMLDVDTMIGDYLTEKQLEEKNSYKSWQYTFTRPLVTWALLAWVSEKSLKQLEKIGTLLWKAYQMRDDILDVTIADWDKTSHYDNKTKFSDIQDGQQTFLTHFIYEKWSYAHRLAISKAMGKRLSTKQINELRTVFVESWAIAYGKELLAEYIAEAKKIIKKLSVKDSSYTHFLLDVVTLLETF